MHLLHTTYTTCSISFRVYVRTQSKPVPTAISLKLRCALQSHVLTNLF